MMDVLQRPARGFAAGLIWLVALFAWPGDHAQAAPARVTGVSLHETAGEAQISIATSGQVRYQERAVQPQWVVVDLLGAELAMPAATLPQSGGQISRVRISQVTPDVVRVVVELTQRVRSTLTPSADGTALIVRVPARESTGQPAATAPRSPNTNAGGIARVTRIALWGTSGKPWVSITASGPVAYRLRTVAPELIVVDVSKAQLALASGKPPAGRGLVKQIRAGQFAPDTVRIVVELLAHVPVHIATTPDRAAIVVSLAAGTKRLQGGTVAQATGVPSSAPSQQPSTANVPPQTPGLQQSAAGAPPAGGTQTAGATLPAPPPASASQPPATRPSESAVHSAATAPVLAPPTPILSTGSQGGDRLPKGAYLLGSEDVLEVSVWGYPDMTRVVTVRPDGQVAVPLAGTVLAAGRSVERLTQDLTRAFAKYIVNPQVTVVVKEFRKIRVSVLGQVTKPGAYTLPPGARILDAVSAASGVTDTAALPQAQLVRASGDTRPLSLDALFVQQDMRNNVLLEPGDTLIIPEDTKNKFYVLGDVNKPGTFPLKGDVTVLQALAVAGGPVVHGTSTSTTAHIVRRVDPNQGSLSASVRAPDTQPIANGGGLLITMDLQKMYQGDLRQNQTLRPGDVMVVPAPGVAALPTILSIIQTLFFGLRL